MNRIAFIFEGNFIYWNSLILVLAAATAVCFFLALYLHRSRNTNAAFLALPLCAAFSLVASRFIHWYCRTGSYASLAAAMSDYTDGGFALVGVFAGCILAAALLRVLRIHKNLPQMLDAMSIAGAAGIALGRLACFFTTADRGQIVNSIQRLPWVYPVTNAVSGAVEYRLATFLIQAIVAGILFLTLVAFYLIGQRRKLKDGDTTLIFLLCYCASQILLDSTRYDSIYFRSNGFVSVVQVLGAVALALVIVLFSIRMVRSRGFQKWHIALWVAIAGLLGGAGYMEYHVQRHGKEALFAYTVMGICLTLVVVLTLIIRALGTKVHQKEEPLTEESEEMEAEAVAEVDVEAEAAVEVDVEVEVETVPEAPVTAAPVEQIPASTDPLGPDPFAVDPSTIASWDFDSFDMAPQKEPVSE